MTGMTEYEEERMKRIQQNRARMEALGLPNIASSLRKQNGNNNNNNNKTHKKHNNNNNNNDDDEDYMPSSVVEHDTSSSSSSSDHHNSSNPKRKKKVVTLKKKVQVQKNKSNSGFDDEDEAFLQAIALSLQEKGLTQNEGCSGLSKSPDTRLAKGKSSEKKGNARIQEEPGTRKRKKQVSSRVQMSEDELVVHFFQFDESGKGSISVNDIEIMAATHDFTWTDKELSDMIHCFISDGTGKLSLDDFRKIVGRCNMIQKKTEGA